MSLTVKSTITATPPGQMDVERPLPLRPPRPRGWSAWTAAWGRRCHSPVAWQRGGGARCTWASQRPRRPPPPAQAERRGPRRLFSSQAICCASPVLRGGLERTPPHRGGWSHSNTSVDLPSMLRSEQTTGGGHASVSCVFFFTLLVLL